MKKFGAIIFIAVYTAVITFSLWFTVGKADESLGSSNVGVSSEASSDITSSEASSDITSSEASSDVTSSEASSEVSSVPLNGYEETEGYLSENGERYVAYANGHKKLTKTEVVRYVNLGFDKPFYTDIKESPNKDNYLVLVNKYYNLGEDFVPKDLKALPKAYKSTSYSVELAGDAYDAFIEMSDAAAAEGYAIKGQSGYRDYEKQKRLYEKYLKNEDGDQAAVDLYSARPGHSEHQTGLAIDVRDGVETMGNFGKTESYKWAKENCWKYGFIIHYTKENKFITGYDTEEWHLRYVGKDAAKEIFQSGVTIDEYLMGKIEATQVQS